MQLKIPLTLAVAPNAWYDIAKKRGRYMKKLTIILASTLFTLLILAAGFLIWLKYAEVSNRQQVVPAVATTPEPTAAIVSTIPSAENGTTSAESKPAEPEATEPAPTEPAFFPKAVSSTSLENWDVQWSVMEGDTVLDHFDRETPISFDDTYSAVPGVVGFRGGNYRTNASYGTVEIAEGTITQLWKANVGFLDTAEWIGCGWTGQPLVAQWDAETRAIMNMYEDKKEKEGLVEAIYAKMDGYVHFIDMEDGSYTRDPLYIGRVFKGSGALDPRGYPILYLGAGLDRGDSQSIYVISLIDGQILYEHSGYHELAPRAWCGLDAGPLIDAETDTLLWACENGMLYTIKMNTVFDTATGNISVNPEVPIIGSYTHNYINAGRYAGFEASITAAKGYVFLADNSGMLLCVDINTMQPIWAQDILDDINATPAFEWEGDDGYLYIAPSADYTGGNMPICKINAETGEIVWQYDVNCAKDPSISGGALASPLLGRSGTNLENLVIFGMGNTPGGWRGRIIAFNKFTGEIVWEYEPKSYMWSSPIALYTEDGKGYIFQTCGTSGYSYLIDGQTGEVINTIKLGATVESSPVAFDNHILIGSRSAMYLLEVN